MTHTNNTQVAVGIDESTMRNAADRILDMDREALNKQAQGNLFFSSSSLCVY